MTSLDKKIQKRGWDYSPFSHVRRELDIQLEEAPFPKKKGKNKKWKNLCKALKAPHEFIPDVGTLGEWHGSHWGKNKKQYRWVHCRGCGKKDWEQKALENRLTVGRNVLGVHI